MIRALYTAASGMTAQQLNVDTISNNMANVNTAAYKKETTNFKSLLYTTMGEANDPNAQTAPTVKQVGHGVRALANSRDYTNGILQETGNESDLALVGNGFFAIGQTDGSEVYTRDGSFRFAMIPDEGSYALVTADGHPVLSTEGESIVVGTEIPMDKLEIGQDGNIYYLDETGLQMDVAQIRIVQFANRAGLEAVGDNLYKETPASGEPLAEVDDDGLTKTTIRTGYLEGSNVQIAQEMVNLIIAQRAYEINSTAIKAADDMLGQANQLKS